MRSIGFSLYWCWQQGLFLGSVRASEIIHYCISASHALWRYATSISLLLSKPSSLLPHFRLFSFLTLCPLLPLSSFSSFFKSHDLSHSNYSILDSSTLSLLDLTHYEAIFKINPHNLMFYSMHGFIALAFTHSALPWMTSPCLASPCLALPFLVLPQLPSP